MNKPIVVWIACLVFLLALSAFLGWRKSDDVSKYALPPGASTTGTSSSEEVKPAFPDITMAAETGRVPVIMYHNVIKERLKDSVWFDCTVEEFQKDIDEIAKEGFSVLSLDQLYEHLTLGRPVPAHSVVLTFDDNYQGFYDYALPILKAHQFPAAMFVHTAYVGGKQGYPKMTWDELKQLHDDGLITIGAHTVTHPSNLKDLPLETQQRELVDSKKALEDHLGGSIVYMAYPDGSNDANTQKLTQDAGYKMAFSTETMLAEGSPNILCVGRYEAKKFDDALKAQEEEIASGQVSIADIPLKKSAVVNTEVAEVGKTKLVLLRGGTPTSILASGRMTVGDFVAQNKGIAGINGTFFVMAAIASNDNRLIGPSRPAVPGLFMPDSDQYRLSKLVDRPMVIWGPSRFAVIPFEPGPMDQEAIFKSFMSDYTDAFLAGAWIVHNGVARTQDQMSPYASQDIHDPRKRAFFGVTKDGEFICGASLGSITTEMLATAVAQAGAFEAVLLDSGFSTSVVFDGQILVTGHSSIDNPSRPVPHAIVFQGEKGSSNLGDLQTVPAVLSTPVTPGADVGEPRDEPRPARRHRRHRRN